MEDKEKLTLSGLQHFAFCRRQWALIFMNSNGKRTCGRRKETPCITAHMMKTQFERRGDMLTVRGLRVFSKRLNVTGVCDVVEFHQRKRA